MFFTKMLFNIRYNEVTYTIKNFVAGDLKKDKDLIFHLFHKMFDNNFECKYIQGISEISVLILTSGRTRQFMKFFLYNIFAKRYYKLI
jgi:hypothetical protein